MSFLFIMFVTPYLLPIFTIESKVSFFGPCRFNGLDSGKGGGNGNT